MNMERGRNKEDIIPSRVCLLSTGAPPTSILARILTTPNPEALLNGLPEVRLLRLVES